MKKVLSILLVTVLLLTCVPLGAISIVSAEEETDSYAETTFNDHSYMIIEEYMKWTEAKEYCESLGGHLVTISSREEQDYLIELSKTTDKKCLWIGFKNKYTDDNVYIPKTWQWVTGEEFYTDGGPADNAFKNFNHTYQAYYQNYGVMYTTNAYNGAVAGQWSPYTNVGTRWDDKPMYVAGEECTKSEFGFICEWDEPYKVEELEIKELINDINLGPYALKGATIDLFGKEIPLINIEANIKLSLGKYLRVIKEENGAIKALFGFDENTMEDKGEAEKNEAYWADTYRTVKSVYQSFSGKKVDANTLWNQFSAMRGKLKTINMSFLMDIDTSLMGYIELNLQNGDLVISEGGIILGVETSAGLRKYYGPVYVSLGIGLSANGTVVFEKENNAINSMLSASGEGALSLGAGLGGRKTYAEIAAYGKLGFVVTNTSSPFSAGLDLGVEGTACILGQEVAQFSKSFYGVQLYPSSGGPWPMKLRLLEPTIDITSKEGYELFINSGTPVSRECLQNTYFLKKNATWDGVSFVKDNAYVMNAPQLVSFDNGTMLLVWVDDTGEKISTNLGTLMYSFYNGAEWSAPFLLFEDGTFNDMPAVCSDGTHAYIVWQKATKPFTDDTELSDMLPYFDLYFTSFDSATQTFTDRVCLTPEEDIVFEFYPTVDCADDTITVAWAENSDNNVYQMSGSNMISSICMDRSFTVNQAATVVSTECGIYDIDLDGPTVYYALYVENSISLYCCVSGETTLLHSNITDFDCENGQVFYSDDTGFYVIDGENVVTYDTVGHLQNFTVKSNGEKYVLFAEQVNEDFSKSLYYSNFVSDSNEWSPFEVYADRDMFINDYVPTMLNDGSVYVAVNYTNSGEKQSGTLVVEQCTEAVDIAPCYVVLKKKNESDGSVDLVLGISNNSSTEFNTFNLQVADSEGTIVDTQIIEGTLLAFGSVKLNINLDVPESATDTIYTFTVLPVGYAELDESNNAVSTTFECVHIFSEAILTDIEATDTASAVMYYACDRCNAKSYIYACGENLTHTYDDVCDTTCKECGVVRESAPSCEKVINSDVYHSITMEDKTGNGLAFRFAMDIEGVEYDGNEYVPGTGTITLHGETHTLKRMGAVVSNDAEGVLDLEHLDAKTVNIEAKYLLGVEEASVAFAARVINIPDIGKDVTIYARPYYVYECEGIEMIVYGNIDATTFQEETDKLNN